MNTSCLALCDVHQQESSVIGILQLLLEPLQLRRVSCAKGADDDSFQSRNVQNRVNQTALYAREEGQHHHIGVHQIVWLERLRGVGLTDGCLIEFDVHASSSQVGIVERAEGIKLLGINLGRAVASHQFLLEVDADLRHNGRAVLVLGRSYLYGGNEVFLAVRPKSSYGQL